MENSEEMVTVLFQHAMTQYLNFCQLILLSPNTTSFVKNVRSWTELYERLLSDSENMKLTIDLLRNRDSKNPIITSSDRLFYYGNQARQSGLHQNQDDWGVVIGKINNEGCSMIFDFLMSLIDHIEQKIIGLFSYIDEKRTHPEFDPFPSILIVSEYVGKIVSYTKVLKVILDYKNLNSISTEPDNNDQKTQLVLVKSDGVK